MQFRWPFKKRQTEFPEPTSQQVLDDLQLSFTAQVDSLSALADSAQKGVWRIEKKLNAHLEEAGLAKLAGEGDGSGSPLVDSQAMRDFLATAGPQGPQVGEEVD